MSIFIVLSPWPWERSLPVEKQSQEKEEGSLRWRKVWLANTRKNHFSVWFVLFKKVLVDIKPWGNCLWLAKLEWSLTGEKHLQGFLFFGQYKISFFCFLSFTCRWGGRASSWTVLQDKRPQSCLWWRGGSSSPGNDYDNRNNENDNDVDNDLDHDGNTR